MDMQKLLWVAPDNKGIYLIFSEFASPFTRGVYTFGLLFAQVPFEGVIRKNLQRERNRLKKERERKQKLQGSKHVKRTQTDISGKLVGFFLFFMVRQEEPLQGQVKVTKEMAPEWVNWLLTPFFAWSLLPAECVGGGVNSRSYKLICMGWSGRNSNGMYKT